MPEFDFESDSPAPEKPDIAEVILALGSGATAESIALAPTIVYGLSDLSPQDVAKLAATWHGLPGAYKARALRQLRESSEADYAFNFNAIALHSLDDDSSLTRRAAVDLLWEDESASTLRRLLRLMPDEDDPQTRSSVLVVLARFILAGEYGDIPKPDADEAIQLALRIHTSNEETLETRCRALEAIGNSSHAGAAGLIRSAYAQGTRDMKRSAIVAMGRSCSPAWRDILLEELESDDEELVFEAAQACGHIQLADSVDPLARLCAHDDREIQLMAIWSLGEIASERAMEILAGLADASEDAQLQEAIEDAQDTANIGRSLTRLFNTEL